MAKAADAPLISASERLRNTRAEQSALHAEQIAIAEAMALAFFQGSETSQLHDRRAALARRLEEITIGLRALEPVAIAEERAQLLAELSAALEYRVARSARLSTLKADYEIKAAELDAIARRIDRFSTGAACEGFTQDTVHRARQRLDRHRADYPSIADPEAIQ